MDPFEKPKQEVYQPPPVPNDFPNFNAHWISELDKGAKNKAGESLERGVAILKKASNLYFNGIGLTALIIVLPAILRFLYELSCWAFDRAGNIFP